MKTARQSPLRLVRPLEALQTVSWAEANVYMSPRMTTPNPGPWRRETVSAMCAPGGPLESLDDPTVELVGVCKGAQSAGTITGYVWLAKELATDPSGVLIVMSSGPVAAAKAREAWLPMWEDSPKLRRLMPANRRLHWTKTSQIINKAAVEWVGANSPGALSSKSKRRVFLDETDKYPQSFGRGNKHSNAVSSSEAGALQLAMQRTKAFRQKGLAKIYALSTPTDDQGTIWQIYQAGDKRHLYVKCHACGVEQVMLWASFRIDMDLAKTDPTSAVAGAHYECPHCKAKWFDRERFAAIDGGLWKPTAISKNPLARTFWFPSWCSKLVNASYLAAQWIGAQASRTALQDFLNGESAEAFVHYENCIKDEVFVSLEGAYREGERWIDVEPYKAAIDDGAACYVIGGVDVQKGYLVACFRLFVDGGDSGLMWHGTVSDFAELDRIATRFKADWIFVDQRYRKREVQEWCFEHTGYVPCEGVKTTARSIFTVSNLDLDEGKRGQGNGRVIEMIGHDGDQVKDILATMIDRRPNARSWMIPKGYGGKVEYVKGMSAERCVNGKWINPGDRPNHPWDCECLTIVGALRLGIMQVGAMEGPASE
jgi:phage terminase large subunit GpA-like protein